MDVQVVVPAEVGGHVEAGAAVAGGEGWACNRCEARNPSARALACGFCGAVRLALVPGAGSIAAGAEAAVRASAAKRSAPEDPARPGLEEWKRQAALAAEPSFVAAARGAARPEGALAARRLRCDMLLLAVFKYRRALSVWREAVDFAAPSFASMGRWTLVEDWDLRSGSVRSRRHAGGRVVVPGTELRPVAARVQPLHLRPLPEVNLAPSTERAADPAEPSDEEQAAFRRACPFWRDCFLPEGWAAFKKAVVAVSAPGVSTSHRGTEARIGQELMAPAARGRIISIDVEGRPSLQVPRRVWDRASVTRKDRPRLDLRKLSKWGHDHGWRDREMLGELEWGLSDGSSNAPLVCSISANHAAAVRESEKMPAAIASEVSEGWIAEGRPFPHSLPCHVNPFNQRPKSGGRIRMMANASWDGPDDERQLFDAAYGALSGNRNVDRAAIAAIVWNSMESMGEAVAVMCALAAEAEVSCRGWRDDLTKWFRQLPEAMVDYRMSALLWEGVWYQNEHLEMGRVRAANIACRVSYMIAAILHWVLDAEVLAIVEAKAASCASTRRLLALLAQRRSLMAGAPGQVVLWHCQVLQDDFGCVALTDEAQAHLYRRIPEVLADYGVECAMEKRVEDAEVVVAKFGSGVLLWPGASAGSPAEVWKFLGGWIDQRVLVEPRLRAPSESVGELERQSAEVWTDEAVGSMVPVQQYQSTIGLLEFLLRFCTKGRPFLNRGYRQCKGLSKLGRSRLSAEWVADVRWFVALLRNGEGGAPAIVDPYWLHPGLLGLNGDACRARPSAENEERGEGGFGGNVGNLAFSGRFSTKELLLLDISTLELVTAYFLVVVLGLALQEMRAAGTPLGRLARRRFVIRCDNESACYAINRGRARSAPMGEAMRLLAGAEAEFGLEIRAEHIAGKANTVADDLSRAVTDAQHAEAVARLQELQSGRDVRLVALPPRWRDLSVVVSAASRQSRREAKRAKRG